MVVPQRGSLPDPGRSALLHVRGGHMRSAAAVLGRPGRGMVLVQHRPTCQKDDAHAGPFLPQFRVEVLESACHFGRRITILLLLCNLQYSSLQNKAALALELSVDHAARRSTSNSNSSHVPCSIHVHKDSETTPSSSMENPQPLT